MNNDVSPVLVSSHERSGTHLLIDYLQLNIPECRAWKLPGESLSRLYYTYGQLLRGDAARYPVRGAKWPIVKIHDSLDAVMTGVHPHYPNQAKQCSLQFCANMRASFHIVRDGRSVMASYHRFMKGHSSAAKRSTMGHFIRSEVDGKSRVAIWAEKVRAGMTDERSSVIRFEDLVKNHESVWHDVLLALNLQDRIHEVPTLPPRLKTRWHARAQRIFHLFPHSTTTLGFTDDALQRWDKALTYDDMRFFESESRGLLIELGYENDEDWPNRRSRNMSEEKTQRSV